MRVRSFDRLEAFAAFLRGSGVDVSRWGIGDSKGLHDLWNEVLSGDCAIVDGPARVVTVAIVIIVDGARVLCESRQRLRDGRVRVRNRPPREKVRKGETVGIAAARCMEEELRVHRGEYDIVRVLDFIGRTDRESASYPGITTRYEQYYVLVDAPCLCREEFSTLECGSINDPVVEHHWVWRDRRELELPAEIQLALK